MSGCWIISSSSRTRRSGPSITASGRPSFSPPARFPRSQAPTCASVRVGAGRVAGHPGGGGWQGRLGRRRRGPRGSVRGCRAARRAARVDRARDARIGAAAAPPAPRVATAKLEKVRQVGQFAEVTYRCIPPMAKSRVRVSLEESETRMPPGRRSIGGVLVALGSGPSPVARSGGRRERRFVEAVHAQRRVQVSMCVVDSWRGLGSLRRARPPPGPPRVAGCRDPLHDDRARRSRRRGRAAVRRVLVRRRDAGLDVWERPAPPAKRPRTGPERFVAEEADRPLAGRADDRIELLRWVADRALSPARCCRSVSQRALQRVHRRCRTPTATLVDHGVLERTRSGSEYAGPPELWITPSTGAQADYRSPVTSRRFVGPCGPRARLWAARRLRGDPEPARPRRASQSRKRRSRRPRRRTGRTWMR